MKHRILSVGFLSFLLLACDEPVKESGSTHRMQRQTAAATREIPVARETPFAGETLDARETLGAEEALGAREDSSRKFLLHEIAAGRRPATEPEHIRRVVTSIWDLVISDTDLARDGFACLPADHGERMKLIGDLAMRLSEKDPTSALVWAQTLPSEIEREAATGRIATVVSNLDPVRAATLISEQMSPGHEQDRAVASVVSRWAQTTPESVAEWLELFEPCPAQTAGLDALADQWIRASIQDAIAWTGGLADTSFREKAALSMARSLGKRPPSEQASGIAAAPTWLKLRLASDAKALGGG